jgi:predicted PurR-regulated permease PerM
VLVGLGVLYLMRDVIGAFVLGALLAFLVLPVVDLAARFGVPRVATILATFAVLIVALVLLASVLIPLLTTEISQLEAQAPGIATAAQDRISHLVANRPLNVFGMRIDLTQSTATLEQHANEFLLGQFGNALGLGLAALTTLFQVLLMLIVAFLIALDAHQIARAMRQLVPNDYRDDFDLIWREIKSMLYAYMRGQLIVAVIIGWTCGLAVWLLGLDFALALGLIAGVTSLIPYLGPFLGALPAILVGLAAGPQQALLVAFVYFIISNAILNFVYPKVVGQAVRLPSILVIVAFLAGFSLAGILGMFVAVPIAATIRILYDYVHPRLYGPAG